MSFQDISRSIVKEYLSNVAFVDDRIFDNLVTKMADENKKPDVNIPDRKQKFSTKVSADTKRGKSSGFDSSELVNAFAKEGMHCALCEYNKMNPEQTFTPLLIKSDVSIIDWELEIGNSSIALGIISKILERDIKETPSLRLIVIYTNSSDISNIIESSIIPTLKELKIKSKAQNEFSLIAGHTKIVVFAKGEIYGVTNLEKYTVKETDLPQKIISEFSELTAGIVSNAALKSISLIRNYSHNLLGILNKDIDPGVLAHKALLPHPEDYSSYIQDLIKGEICSLIESEKVRKVLSEDKIENWVNRNYSELSQKIKVNERDYKLEEKSIVQIANKGIFNSDAYVAIIDTQVKNLGLNKRQKRKFREDSDNVIHKNLTSLFNPNGVSSEEINLSISVINSLKHNIALGINPKLGFGSIIKDLTDKYWLCIQPKCDSVRIKRTTSFFFLGLRVVGAKESFDIVINENGDCKRIKVEEKIIKARQIEFEGDEEKEIVLTSNDEDSNLFFTDANKQKFFWCGELKTEYAQRIVNNFAAHIARVGTDEYEWLRRS